MNIDEALAKAVDQLDAQAATPAPEADPAPTGDSAPVQEATRGTRPRDEAGRFAKGEIEGESTKKPAAAPEGAAGSAPDKAATVGRGAAEGAVTPAAPSAPPVVPAPIKESQLAGTEKAPTSWRPLAKEHWASLPGDVRTEWSRREREMAGYITRTEEARKTVETVQRSLAPYEGLARAQGMDAMSYAGSVLQTAAQLFQGPAPGRAAIIAQLIKQSGVNPEDVNPYLSGEAQAPRAPQVDVRGEIDRRFTEIQERMESQHALVEAKAFLDGGPEFYSAVGPDMQEILRLDRARGGNMTLQAAYDRACRMNEEVQAVVQKRKTDEAARTAHAATQAGKSAAVSIKSQATAVPRMKTKGIDAALEAAAEKLGI